MHGSICKFGSRFNDRATHSGKKGNQERRVRADFLSGRWGVLIRILVPIVRPTPSYISWMQIPDRVGHGNDGWIHPARFEVEELRAERRGAAVVHSHRHV